jgi:septal ring factor EnvC (AmiA/AmiB activator)
VIAESKEVDPEGRGVSKGGILGNTDAKAYYDRYKYWKGFPRRKNAVSRGQGVTTVQRRINPNRDTARVRNRLTRKCKAELVDSVLELEQGIAVQEEQWLRLNDELLQWRLRAEKAEGQIDKMRGALSAKEAQVRELQKRLDDVLAAGLRR